jgi:imidazolonepropionase-like amidohydrolase
MNRPLRIRGALAWTGPGSLVENAAIVIDGERTRYAGTAFGAPQAEDEVAGEWFLMPGAIDHHVHIRLSDPRAILHGGVTFCRDLAWAPEEIFPLVDISQGTDFEGPSIVAAGPMITAVGGYPSQAGWCPPGGWIEVKGPDQAVTAVERVVAQDPAIIKVALNSDVGPTLTDAELVAICEYAHARKLAVTAHVQGSGQTERALGAGIDELAHCPWTERLSDDLIEALARRTGIVSTLDIHAYGSRTPELDVAVDNLRRFAEAGGRVRYGTDLGNGPIPPGIHQTEAAHLAAAGLSVDAILQAMTLAPLRAGAEGDVVGLRGNPFEDLSAFGRVELVVSRGRVRRYT